MQHKKKTGASINNTKLSTECVCVPAGAFKCHSVVSITPDCLHFVLQHKHKTVKLHIYRYTEMRHKNMRRTCKNMSPTSSAPNTHTYTYTHNIKDLITHVDLS